MKLFAFGASQYPAFTARSADAREPLHEGVVRRVQRRERRGVERSRRPEEEAERPTLVLEPGVRRERYVDERRADPAARDAVLVAHELVALRRHARRLRRRRAVAHPAFEVEQACVQHGEGHACVDRRPATQHAAVGVGRVEDRPLRGAVARIGESEPCRVLVGVRGAGDLPETEVLRVGLARREVAEAEEVALGLQRHDRHVDVGAGVHDLGDRRVGQAEVGGAEARSASSAAVDVVAVVHVREVMDRVHVRRQSERRLRLAQRDHSLDVEVAERLRPRGRRRRRRLPPA